MRRLGFRYVFVLYIYSIHPPYHSTNRYGATSQHHDQPPPHTSKLTKTQMVCLNTLFGLEVVRERSNHAIYVSSLSILSNRYQSTSLSPPSPTPLVCTFISTMITGLVPSFDSTIVIYVHCLPLLLFSVTIVTVESQ